MAAKRTALVIGATGNFGGAMAQRLAAEGWDVRALHRAPDRLGGEARSRAAWIEGDAMSADDVTHAAAGAELIVHGANPPGYRNWKILAPAMLEATLAAAKVNGAQVLFPGNVYNYGPDAFPMIGEAAPQHPTTRKGAIRVAMEARLRDAADAGTRVLIVRFGDFFGPRAGASDWFSQGIVPKNRPLRRISYPGDLGVRHAWAFLPDIAETCARLLDAPLGEFEVFHMAGHGVTGHELVAALAEAVGGPVSVGRIPWLAVQALAPINETFREMLEMRYLWDREVLLENTRLARRLGAEPRTPLPEALRQMLAGLGALPLADLQRKAAA